MANTSPISELRRILTNFDLPVPSLVTAPQGEGGAGISLWVKGRGQVALKPFGNTSAAHLFSEDVAGVTAAHIITGSVLFANAEHVAHEAVRAALTAIGTRLVTDVPKSSFAYQDLLLRTGALYVARHVGLSGHNAIEVIEHLASLYNAAAAPVVDRIREEFDPAFCRAADALARCPVSKVTRGVLTHYMALDVEPDGRQAVAALRLRAAAAYPALAGFFAMSPAIADAIDAGEKLFPVVERQTGGLFTKSVMNRLGQAVDHRAVDAVEHGMLVGIPPDQIPRTDGQWKAALDLWDASTIVADSAHVSVREVWKAERIVQARGDWEGMTKSIVSKGVDTRPPHGIGLTKEDAIEVAGSLDIKPFTQGDDILDIIFVNKQKAWQRLQAISERDGRIAYDAFNAEKFSEWVLRLGYREVTPASLASSLRGATEAASLFGQRVVLPTVLVAGQVTGLPITSGSLEAATASGFEFLTEGMTFPQLAAFSRQFTARAPFLTAPIISSRERQAEVMPVEDPKPERLRIDDHMWREVFRITEDRPDWPVLTPIIEFLPGIVFVPVENLKQAQEEGTLTLGKLDRNGVPELGHCLGVIHAPKAMTANGAYQLFSIREVKDGTYRRLASGTFKMSYDETTMGVKIHEPGAHEFNGLSNAPPPPEAREVFRLFKEFVAATPQALNEAVIDAVKVQKNPGARERVRPDLTLPKLLGYNPFQSYKIETAWEIWRDQGLIGPNWLEKPLAERANLEPFQQVHEANRALLVRMGITDVIQPRTVEVKPLSAVKPSKGMTGIFF
jgi:hypothetical protein